MGACKYRFGVADDSGSGAFLWRHGTSQERSQHDDDVDDNDRNRQRALGNLRI